MTSPKTAKQQLLDLLAELIPDDARDVSAKLTYWLQCGKPSVPTSDYFAHGAVVFVSLENDLYWLRHPSGVREQVEFQKFIVETGKFA